MRKALPGPKWWRLGSKRGYEAEREALLSVFFLLFDRVYGILRVIRLGELFIPKFRHCFSAIFQSSIFSSFFPQILEC